MLKFEFDGEQYKAASRHQKEWGDRLIAELPLTGGERVLDLGCGDGVLTERLARRVPRGRVIGILLAPAVGVVHTFRRGPQQRRAPEARCGDHLHVVDVMVGVGEVRVVRLDGQVPVIEALGDLDQLATAALAADELEPEA